MICNDPTCSDEVLQCGYCSRHFMMFYRYGPDYAKLPGCRQCGGPTDGKSRIKKYCDLCARDRIRQDRIRANNRRRSQSGTGDHYTIQMLLDMDGDTCYLCMGKMIGRPSIDHIVPLSRGGTDTINNVALTHWECNNRKKAKTLGDSYLEFPNMRLPERVEISNGKNAA
jgi:5-methylcytosine-specific restriction endonuclease McrA